MECVTLLVANLTFVCLLCSKYSDIMVLELEKRKLRKPLVVFTNRLGVMVEL